MTTLTLNKRRRNARTHATTPWRSPMLLMTAGLFLFYLLLGGSSRFDNLSLPILRPVAVLATFYGLWRLPSHRPRAANAMLGIVAAAFAITLLYLVPLPPTIWHHMAGHTVIADVDRVAELGAVYRPLTVSPALTQNAFFALFVPASILVNGLCLSDEELPHLASAVLAGALASCLLATAQLLGPSDGILYLYSSTTNGAAVGLFANRNHHAIFLAAMLPVITVYAAMSYRKRKSELKAFAALLLACLVVPMLLVIGSRGGFAAAVAALLFLPFLYKVAAGRPSFRSNRKLQITIGATVILLTGIGLWATFSSRAETLARITSPGGDQELRFKVWPIVIEHIGSFAPWGSGPGTYELAYKLIEPDADLRPTYSNHAHNDWIEVPFTTGIPGTLLLLTATGLLIATVVHLIRRRANLPNRAWSWAGIVMLIAFGIGSGADYPLRVPSLLALLVIACLWIKLGATPQAPETTSAVTTDEGPFLSAI